MQLSPHLTDEATQAERWKVCLLVDTGNKSRSQTQTNGFMILEPCFNLYAIQPLSNLHSVTVHIQ